MAETIIRYRMVSAHDRIGVAVSGGADSVVLLHLLKGLSVTLQIELLVFHVNHGLRGAESDADELFVRQMADRLHLECRVGRCPVANNEGNLEQAARDGRRRFFQQHIESGLVRRVATGHTLSDQAETVLYRLFRGAGLAGLSGMRFVTPDNLIRPLLGLTRGEVRDWASIEGLVWREDTSNLEARFRRNRIRHELLPLASEVFHPRVEHVIAGTAMLAQSEEDYWHALVAELFPKFAQISHFGLLGDVPFLQRQHPCVQRRLIRKSLCEIKGDLRSLDSTHVEAVIRICTSLEGHDRVMIPGVDVLRSFHRVRFAKPTLGTAQPRHYRVSPNLGACVELPFGAGAVRLDLVEGCRERDICANFNGERGFAESAKLAWGALGGPAQLTSLAIRNWEPGDAYRRLGHRSTEKLKTLFQEHKVPLWERRHWPVLEFNDEIVWTRQFGASADFGAADCSFPALLLRYRTAHESNVTFSTSTS